MKLFLTETYLIDRTTGPQMITRQSLNPKVIKGFLGVIALILAAFLYLCTLPEIKVKCTTSNILVFQDMNDNYLAYVELANAEQLEQIKNLNVLVDESVENFTLCASEVHHFELRLAGEKVFVHGNDVVPPEQYNYELSSDELTEMLQSSSEEAQYLYQELSRIFKTA